MLKKKKELLAALETLAESWPILIPAKELPRLLGGLYTAKSLANLRWLGKGPKAFKRGSRIFYLRPSVVDWLAESSQAFDPDSV